MGMREEAHPHPSDPIRISKLTVQDSECPLGSRVPGCVEHHQARRACLPGSWLEPLLHSLMSDFGINLLEEVCRICPCDVTYMYM